MTETPVGAVEKSSVLRTVATHPKLEGIEVYLAEVGPEAANELLALNSKSQRSLSRLAVERCAVDMVTGDWMFNGASILISNAGELIDGQHRLTAIVESGEPQVLMIVRGVHPEAMSTVDTNRRRTYADVLKIAGYANHVTLAAINGRNWQWFHGNYGVSGTARVREPQFLSATPSNAQKDLWMHTVQKAYDITFPAAAKFAQRAYHNRRGITAATYGLSWIILSGINKDLREQFFHELITESASSKSGYPIVALANRLNRLRPGNDFSPVDQLDALFTTYNAWVQGKTLMTLSPPRPVRFDTVEIPDGYTELEISK